MVQADGRVRVLETPDMGLAIGEKGLAQYRINP